jgi:hypothetical protein
MDGKLQYSPKVVLCLSLSKKTVTVMLIMCSSSSDLFRGMKQDTQNAQEVENVWYAVTDFEETASLLLPYLFNTVFSKSLSLMYLSGNNLPKVGTMTKKA